jgi:solute carrier family 25 carnitine/acylcarnitine transporter 20/29
MKAQNESNKNYNGVIRPLKTVFQTEGIKPLFRGLGATAIRAFPTNAVTFYTVILVKNYLDAPYRI